MNPFSDIYDPPPRAPNKFNGYVKTAIGFKETAKTYYGVSRFIFNKLFLRAPVCYC